MARGFFVTFEGLDGSGKTTQVARLTRSLELAGHTVTCLRQPGGTALGDRIRTLLVDSRAEAELGAIAPLAELALMFADRAQSIAELITPALAAGHIVLCDRFTDSSEAYQGGGRQLGPERVRALHNLVCGGLAPDLTLLLLPPLAASLDRAHRRNARAAASTGVDENRFEREGVAFFERVYACYETIAAREPERVAVLRGNASVEQVAASILSTVEARLASHLPPPASQRPEADPRG